MSRLLFLRNFIGAKGDSAATNVVKAVTQTDLAKGARR
jgi:hypothetical protein